MRIGDTLKKAAGLFVEIPPEEAGMTDMTLSEPLPAETPAPTQRKTVEEIVRESEGPNLDEIKVQANASVQPVTSDGTVDFASIYRMANVPTALFTAEQVLDLVAGLPKELPLETKRQTVKVTLGAMAKTMGVTPETIVADASRKLAALAAYSESFTHQASEYVSKSEAEISNLQRQIEERHRLIAEAKTRQQAVVDGCHKESDRLDDVLEFFSLDVPPSKYASQSPS